MLKYESCLTSGRQHLLPNFETLLQLSFTADWSLHCSTAQKRLREMVNICWLLKATKIQNCADANMEYHFYEAVKTVCRPKSYATHSVLTKGWILCHPPCAYKGMGFIQRQERHPFSLGGAHRGIAKSDQTYGQTHSWSAAATSQRIRTWFSSFPRRNIGFCM